MSTPTFSPHAAPKTHEVTNQSVPLQDYDVFSSNTPLAEALDREGAGWARDRCETLGRLAGSEEAKTWGAEANENTPVLKTHDRYGNRVDEVVFHPSWHKLMDVAVSHELHSLPWTDPQPGAHVARAAMFMSWNVDAGHGCPISMTYAGIPALRSTPELAEQWEPRLMSKTYDPRLVDAREKAGALCGMAMTEKQGGSDVRANSTVAKALNGGGPGAEYELTGHKWFCSAPMCDVFLTLAQTDEGLSCFLLPRVLPDGSRNEGFRLQRLKDKLGNRSNASSEVEYHGAWAQMLGEPGRGVPTIIHMVNHTRLDCVIGAAGGMRRGVEEAIWHAQHRSAFGKLLIEQPLMRNVLADLAIESEAATLTAMRLARSYDTPADDEQEMRFKRIATAVAKYWTCKRWPVHTAEALECFGGAGYVEESGMPRLYREAPLNGIWEGSGNVICLDVLRALVGDPLTGAALLDEIGAAAGADARLDAYVAELKRELSNFEDIESRARRVVERMALALQGSLVVRYSPPEVADAFCASRLDGDSGRAFGTLPSGIDLGSIIERHAVAA
jgi:putative acyl-CoA dehydrogenase